MSLKGKLAVLQLEFMAPVSICRRKDDSPVCIPGRDIYTYRNGASVSDLVRHNLGVKDQFASR